MALERNNYPRRDWIFKEGCIAAAVPGLPGRGGSIRGSLRGADAILDLLPHRIQVLPHRAAGRETAAEHLRNPPPAAPLEEAQKARLIR